ncbi:MAG TPA: FtsX-like permease family protein [Ruminiclostridium sp.]
MRNYKELTSRYLKQHKGRTILTLVGIIIAIAMFTCIGSIYYSGINSEIERVKDEKGNFEVLFYDASKDKINVLTSNAEIKDGGVVNEEGSFQIDNSLLTDSLKKMDIKAYDGGAFKDIFRVKIVEGRFPENGSEIVVDKKYYAVLKDKKIGKVLKGELKSKEGATSQGQYTVVGSYESKEITNWGLSFLDIRTSADTNKYSYFANLKQGKNKVDVAQKIAKANDVKLDINSSLLYLLGEGPDKSRNNSMEVIFGIIAAFVVVCTTVVIYNSFNISVMERIKHFGILRSIGATKSQIRNLVFKEAAIMSLIAIPIGILSGFAGIMITFNVFMDGFLGEFQIGFYPQVIIGAALLGLITVFLSAFFPARTASKVSPIDAIRGTMIVKGDKIKRGSGLLAKLIFNFEGQVAYKNIKRSRKRFYITCISLMISLIMFVFFSNFIDIIFESNKIVSSSTMVEGMFSRQQKSDSPYLSKTLVKNINSLEGIKELYELKYASLSYLVDKEKVNDKFVSPIKRLKTTNEYKGKYIIGNVQIAGYDEKTIELFNKQNKTKIGYESFNKNNGIIIVNKAAGEGANNKRFYDSFTEYKIGDEIALPVLDESYVNKPDTEQLKKYIDSGKTINFKVAGVIDYETIGSSMMYNSYGMIMSTENYNKLTGVNGLSVIAVNFASPEYSSKYYEKFNIMADENKASYMDIYTQKKQSDNLQNQMMILVYGFIGLIVLISTVNIINTVTINLLVKKREYATFKAIGMTKGQFKKLVLLEGALFGIIACIIGLPVSFLLTYFGIVRNNPLGFIGYTPAIWPYAVGGIGIILITLLAAMIPLRKLNDMNIVEALRIEE